MTGLHWLGATMRLLKLLEVPKLLRGNYGKWWDLLKVRYSVNSYVALTARFFSILVLVNHWCACVWLALGWMPAEGLPTWSRVLRQEAIAGTSSYDDSKEFEAYFTSWYWALTTMSTIGYGDVSPTNVLERVFASSSSSSAFSLCLRGFRAILRLGRRPEGSSSSSSSSSSSFSLCLRGIKAVLRQPAAQQSERRACRQAPDSFAASRATSLPARITWWIVRRRSWS